MLLHIPERLTWRERFSLLLYQCAVRLLQVLLPIKLAKRARQEPGYSHDVPARFGRYTQPSAQDPAPQGLVWVHAVSLGETRASAALIAQLRQLYPQLKLLLTHGTATGLEAGKALLRDGDQQTWLPWDSASAVNSFLQHFRPRLGLVMETEVWPQLCVSCAGFGVPLYVVNARMSQRSMAKAKRLPTLSRLAFRHLAGVVAQTAEDGQRLAALGANLVGVVGNIKFDVAINEQQIALGQSVAKLGKPVVMLASSRDGEEAMWLQAISALSSTQRASAQWLVVPRHPQRVAQVQALLAQAGWQTSLRSTWGEQLQTCATAGEQHTDNTVWLGDSMGEMAMYYAMSRVAMLGGSFAPLGGQNLIEAAACGSVVLAGPHTFNFTQATQQAIEAGACVRVADMAQALNVAVAMLAKPEELERRSQAGVSWTNGHRGAAARTVALLQAHF